MSTSGRSKSVLPVAHAVLIPVSGEVQVDGVSIELMQFALKLAYIHYLMFDSPLWVTAGKPALGCGDPSHDAGLALDVRTNDITPSECEVFLAVTDYLAAGNKIIRGPAPLGDDYASMHLELKPQ